jgi:hypothetical protein
MERLRAEEHPMLPPLSHTTDLVAANFDLKPYWSREKAPADRPRRSLRRRLLGR